MESVFDSVKRVLINEKQFSHFSHLAFIIAHPFSIFCTLNYSQIPKVKLYVNVITLGAYARISRCVHPCSMLSAVAQTCITNLQ